MLWVCDSIAVGTPGGWGFCLGFDWAGLIFKITVSQRMALICLFWCCGPLDIDQSPSDWGLANHCL